MKLQINIGLQIIILLSLFLDGCIHIQSYVRHDFVVKDKRIAILPFKVAEGIKYEEEMSLCSKVFWKEMQKRKVYKLSDLDGIERFLKEKGFKIKREDFQAIGTGLGVDYLLIGEITKWRKYRHRPGGFLLPGLQSFTEVEIKIILWDVEGGKVAYEDVDGLSLQGDYGKGHTFVSYEEVVRQISKNFIRRLPR